MRAGGGGVENESGVGGVENESEGGSGDGLWRRQ